MRINKSQANNYSKAVSTLNTEEDSLFVQLESASNLIEERLDREILKNQRAQLDSSLQGHSSSHYTLAPNLNWSPLLKRRTIHLPDVLFDQYDIDNRLFLWDYVDGNDFASFEQLEEIISSITLAKPKPGLFVADIQHVLVIATPLIVTIVGLSLKPTTTSTPELSLYLTGLSISTDGILFTSIHSHSSTGRIFLLGSTDSDTSQTNGNELYEFEYRSEEGWFKKRCTLINHSRGSTSSSTISNLLPTWLSSITFGNINMIEIDQDRNLIYLLNKNGSLKMLSLGREGKDTPKELSNVGNVVREALGMCPSAGPLLDPRTFEINSLNVISKLEGGKVALVLTTTLGVRLYFSHARRGYGYGYVGLNSSTTTSSNDPDWNPTSLWLCHVRLPPRPSSNPSAPTTHQHATNLSLVSNYEGQENLGIDDRELPTIPTTFKIETTHYTSPGGYFLAAHSTPESDRTLILSTAPDQISEISSTIPIDGHAWAITHLNNIYTDHDQNDLKEWLVLSNMGITVLSNQRPVDTLASLLDNMPGREQDLNLFWEKFGRDETCAMCIWISVTDLISPDQPKPQTNQKGTLLGGVGNGSLGHQWGTNAAPHAKKLLFESSGRPKLVKSQVPSINYGSSSVIEEGRKIVFSGKLEGLALYLSWIVKPIWRQKVTIQSPQNNNLLISNVPEQVLMKVQKDLTGLRTFVDNEAVLLTASLPDMRNGRTDPSLINLEQNSFDSIRALLTQAIEAISFILLLTDYKFTEIIQSCGEEVRNRLLNLNYREFIIGKVGRDCARELVKTLINLQIGKDFSVDAISETLQQRCGSFCTSDDVLLYKAIEALNRAKESDQEYERREYATEALCLFKKGAKHISLELLQHASTQFISINALDAVIELSLTCAKVWNNSLNGGNQALSYWLDGKPSNEDDPRKSIYTLIDNCYCVIEKALDEFSPTGKLSLEDALAIREHAIQLALSTDDELFHYHYYDHLLSQNQTIQLLDAGTEFVESYLKVQPTTLVKADLLWQHYARQSAFFEAARILANLATDESLPLSLPRRIEYLSLAVSNAKSSPSLTSNSENGGAFAFLTDLEEKLDVAQVQVEVLQNVLDLEGGADNEAVTESLQRRLLTISELYAEVVQPLGLLDATLLIFHVSDHRDESLTETVWRAIIERAHLGKQGSVRGPEAVASKVAELGRKFYPSDIAFNLPMVVSVVERYAFENQSPGQSRWVGPMLREAGVPAQAIWESMDELFTTKVPPWHVNQTLAFLAYELEGVVNIWLEEVTSAHHPVYDFPAARLVDVLERYAVMLGTGTGSAREEYAAAARRLGEMKIRIRETF
ncbi:hypothetical protein CROQUDRAFT_96882 [Cronartium quercuum f. sp. fusiforme G11]|uniref:Uncharacterized protein n=1 Tax=Cronartium quercuum f. sp. fusiforme G11 TaxID=708437 RepID=A0A9P6NG18_9BASI|nr:hypothetical protein CROQUDRAFT_96882 [Cronartium quercuum f. sp. fusiforme G11]